MKNGGTRRLPEAEERVMQALWACSGPAERTEIEKQLRKPMAPTTLLTLLSRLAEKGCVEIEKRGRLSVYTPKLTKREYLASESRHLMEQLCAGSVSDFASALCSGGLTKEELQTLRQLLEEAET